MHELSVTESILDIATRHAVQASANQVTAINLVIGRLSTIIDDSVQFYWDIISQNTLCAGAKLSFVRIPARMACAECHTEYEFENELIPCPTCGSYLAHILSGDEFRVDSIEVVIEQETMV